jgi:hypothetical protein
MCDMQRICGTLLTLVPGLLAAQQPAGTELWRLAATTLPTPPALARGGAATFWNPAQPVDSERGSVAFEAIETSPAIGARGMLITARARITPIGAVGLVYGRMSLAGLVRTSISPDPDPGDIPYYTQTIGVNWATTAAATTVGATLGYHDTQLDATRADRWTLDMGASRTLFDRVRLAAATHFFSRFAADDPAQDLYAGAELRVWHGRLWGRDEKGEGGGGTSGAIRARYGTAFAHGFTADHQFGAAFEVDRLLALDLVVVREGSYGEGGWRPIAGMRLAIGRYRLSFARDAALNDVGAAYRVGLEARWR